MGPLAELRKKAAALHDEVEAILDKALEEERGLTEEEHKEHDEKRDAYKALSDTIRMKEEAEEEARRLVASTTSGDDTTTTTTDTDDDQTRDVATVTGGHDRAEDKPFTSLGEQMRAVVEAASPGGAVAPRLHGITDEWRAATGLSEAVPADGGFLLEKTFVPTIIEKTYATGKIVKRIDTLPIGPNSNGMKLPAIDETSRVDGSRMGGIRAYWADEAALKTASKPKFRRMELTLNKVIALVYTTDELLADATALGAWIEKNLPIELRFKVEDAVVNGTGAGQPRGIMTAGGCLVTVAKEAGQLAATIMYENIVKMYARFYDSMDDIAESPTVAQSVWLANRDIFPQLANMGIIVGVGGSPAFVPANGAAGRPYNELMGIPIVFVEYCATLGTAGDLILSNLDEYQMIDKGGVESAYSIHVRFLYDEGVFRFVYRVDGQPKWNSALTPYKGTNTVSPFVALATRA